MLKLQRWKMVVMLTMFQCWNIVAVLTIVFVYQSHINTISVFTLTILIFIPATVYSFFKVIWVTVKTVVPRWSVWYLNCCLMPIGRGQQQFRMSSLTPRDNSLFWLLPKLPWNHFKSLLNRQHIWSKQLWKHISTKNDNFYEWKYYSYT